MKTIEMTILAQIINDSPSHTYDIAMENPPIFNR